MTWNPLKKKLLTIRPSPAPPLIPTVQDRELDFLVQKLMQFEETSKFLIKKVKQYSQQMLAVDEADQHLNIHLSECSLVHINDELRNIVEDYTSVTTQVGRSVHSIKGLCMTTFVEPLKKFREELIKIEASLAKREELVTNWRMTYNRLQKLQEKKDRIASHIAKLEIENKTAEGLAKELKQFHSDLIVTLKALIDKRLRIIKPFVYALIMIQLDYYGNMTKMFTHLISVQNLADSSNNDSWEKLHKDKITSEMTRIKDLAIIKTLKI